MTTGWWICYSRRDEHDCRSVTLRIWGRPTWYSAATTLRKPRNCKKKSNITIISIPFCRLVSKISFCWSFMHKESIMIHAYLMYRWSAELFSYSIMNCVTNHWVSWKRWEIFLKLSLHIDPQGWSWSQIMEMTMAPSTRRPWLEVLYDVHEREDFRRRRELPQFPFATNKQKFLARWIGAGTAMVLRPHS